MNQNKELLRGLGVGLCGNCKEALQIEGARTGPVLGSERSRESLGFLV